MAMFDVSSVRCTAGGRTILDVNQCAIAEGDHVLLQGLSGSGKTTLMSVLAGLRKPDSGRVAFRGQDLAQMNADDLDLLRGATFGFVMQGFHLLRHLSVAENLALARYAGGLSSDDQKIKSVLERLDISHLSDARASTLSMGEAQRVAVARALMNDPAVIFADEPTSALDDLHAGLIISLLIEQAQMSNAALIVATHDARIKSRFSRVINIHGGRVAA
jgi:putative ABC transport system ATP-binding protein